MEHDLITTEDSAFPLRCAKCHKLLAKSGGIQNSLEIKCLRCGEINVIFQQMKDQVIITDPKGKILFANNVTEEITGYKLEEIIGNNPSMWGGNMSKEFYRKLWKTVLKERKSFIAKVTNTHKSGKPYKVFLRISPILDTKGAVKFLVGVESLININLSLKKKE